MLGIMAGGGGAVAVIIAVIILFAGHGNQTTQNPSAFVQQSSPPSQSAAPANVTNQPSGNENSTMPYISLAPSINQTSDIANIDANYIKILKSYALEHGGGNGDMSSLSLSVNDDCSGPPLADVYNKNDVIREYTNSQPLVVHAGDVNLVRPYEEKMLLGDLKDPNGADYNYACTSVFGMNDKIVNADNQQYAYTEFQPLQLDRQNISVLKDYMEQHGTPIGVLQGHNLDQYFNQFGQTTMISLK